PAQNSQRQRVSHHIRNQKRQQPHKKPDPQLAFRHQTGDIPQNIAHQQNKREKPDRYQTGRKHALENVAVEKVHREKQTEPIFPAEKARILFRARRTSKSTLAKFFAIPIFEKTRPVSQRWNCTGPNSGASKEELLRK